jgi:catechol 2,3-dioxygenase-like lactoylglutathione lyase family enzyme
MSITFTSITVNTPNLENMLRFYEILGCEFTAVKVDKGGQLHRSSMHGFELSLLSIQHANTAPYPKVMMSFKVDNFDQKMVLLLKVPGVLSLLEPTELPAGKTALVLDPDGHSIELQAV